MNLLDILKSPGYAGPMKRVAPGILSWNFLFLESYFTEFSCYPPNLVHIHILGQTPGGSLKIDTPKILACPTYGGCQKSPKNCVLNQWALKTKFRILVERSISPDH